MARYRGRGPDAGVAAMVVGAIAIATLVERPPWAQVLIGTAWAAAVAGWWALFRKRTTCGVVDGDDPDACATVVRGRLRACSRPEHRLRKREQLLRAVREPAGQRGARPNRSR